MVKPHAFIIEKNFNTRKLLKETLENVGCTVTEIGDKLEVKSHNFLQEKLLNQLTQLIQQYTLHAAELLLTEKASEAIIKQQDVNAVLKSEYRYRTFMNSSSYSILLHDEQGFILDANKQSEILFNISKEELIGRNFLDFILPIERQNFENQLKKIMQERNSFYGEFHINNNNNIRDIEVTLKVVEINNQNLFLEIINDVTERNTLRKKTLLSDKLATLGTISAGIVHEINNPLTWVSSNLYLLKEYVQSLNTKDRKSLHEQLVKMETIINESINGANQIAEIVKNLRGFARVDESDKVPTDIHETMEASIKIAHSIFKNRATINKNFDNQIPRLLVNQGKLQQVFLNLIINAAQAIPEGNPTSNQIILKTHLEADKICIDITDTGTGIPSEILSKIFDPFFTSKPHGVGTGLGLSICQEIITSLRGKIQVKSKPGKTTFSIQLPLELGEKEKIYIGTKLNILIIDDEPSLLHSLKYMLEPYYTVTALLDGKKALEVLELNAKKFDVIISDLNMPEVNGRDIYHFLLEKNRELAHRMILMSGNYDHSCQEFIKETHQPYLEKPFKKQALLDAINELMAMGDHYDR